MFEAVDRAHIKWDDLAELSEAEVYQVVFPHRGEYQSVYAQPDWDAVHKELARVGVTLKLLHSEYVDEHASTNQPVMSYDRFCRIYQKYVLQSGVTSRVGHKAGQTVEVDWSGPTMRLEDPVTGKTQKVYLFVACLPFSGMRLWNPPWICIRIRGWPRMWPWLNFLVVRSHGLCAIT